MGRASGLCHLCPQMRRSGRYRVHRGDPVAHCAGCREPVCDRHVRWDPINDRWLCRRCERNGVTVDEHG